ncbi:MAG: NAD-glutamate dehydrogenase [Pseudomonadota bacterium]
MAHDLSTENVLTETLVKDILNAAKEKDLAAFDDEGRALRAFEEFVEQLVHYATGEAAQLTDREVLVGHATNAWAASARRAPGEDLVELRADAGQDWRSARLVLNVVTDDKPFLVDSISAALSERGKVVSFFINAVVESKRDDGGARAMNGKGRTVREAMIHIEMDPAADEQEPALIEQDIRAVLADVSVAVQDWEPMRARLAGSIAALERARPKGVDREDLREAVDFLKWLWDNRFAFLGARRYSYADDEGGERFAHDIESDLGILRDPERRILRGTLSDDGRPTAAVKDFMTSAEPILVAKSNAKSVVHRRAYMDYVGVKIFGPDGEPAGEERFVGLFTADAYNKPATDIPLLRRRIEKVVERSSFSPGGHNEKALVNILETYPRDEIFQVNVEELSAAAVGVMRLYKRPRTKVFIRRDRFDRFVSAMVFIPRDRFNSYVREEIGETLRKAYKGRLSAFYPTTGEGPLARVHYIVGLDDRAPAGPSIKELDAAVTEIVQTWADRLKDAMRGLYDGAPPRGLFQRYENAFTAGYKEANDASEALSDIEKIEALSAASPRALRAYRRKGDRATYLRLKLYNWKEPIPLSVFLPVLENMGLNVLQEAGHPVTFGDKSNTVVWVHDFLTAVDGADKVDLEAIRTAFEGACLAVLEEQTEDDGFNALVVNAGLNWREAAMLRGAARHHAQSGFAFSHDYMAQTLNAHPDLTKLLVELFHARFHPSGEKDPSAREKDESRVLDAFATGLDTVASLDEDRIFRRFVNFIKAVTRTNYYQKLPDGSTKPYMSFKIASRTLEELPDPKPFREIFVSSPRVDGVHLRFGAVARGGLRWSDRREDFRTEILDLVKAQQVKNAVIVPVGSKGGFYPKHLPKGGDRDAVFAEGREAYKYFIRGLLDVTDNIVNDEIVTPDGVAARDEQDPYLVVAADKGTAVFSDTANGIAEEYGFWLGDAFASGGSAGYDHKAMGITARGAWEAVKRHFREMGKDIQSEPFTVTGVGDMSGDVFGNGMLLSRQIKLIAAFDHRDIFIDPDPDPETSYAERERLFNAPRTSWQDYDKALISKGGGVFSRQAKSVALSPEMKALLNLKQDKASPNEILQAILKTPTELFWLGGIGTYYKAPGEENWRVGDRANDAIRIDVTEAGAKVIGEGANLGLTQDARIAFARAGGRVNTDAVDNSAGVDSSDHEVNIKILLNNAIGQGALAADDRNDLLAAMTDDVARHVLRNNYDQTLALSLALSSAADDLDAHERFMQELERLGRLDRDLEGLPHTDEVAERKAAGRGLTRPELSVLMAYAKIWLFDEIIASNVPDHPYFEDDLAAYFPEQLHGFDMAIKAHRLRREIITTRLSNQLVNICGLTFAYRVVESTGATPGEVALAFEIARRVFDIDAYAASVNALDNKTPADAQFTLHQEAIGLLRRQVYWLLSSGAIVEEAQNSCLTRTIERYHAGVLTLREHIVDYVSEFDQQLIGEHAAGLRELGVPEDIADAGAGLRSLNSAPDIVDLARDHNWPIAAAARIYFATGAGLGLDRMRASALKMKLTEHFDRLAVRRLVEDVLHHQRALAGSVIASLSNPPEEQAISVEWAETVFADWRDAHARPIERATGILAELDVRADLTVGKLALANRQIRELADWTQN